jgi:hypothetical protein
MNKKELTIDKIYPRQNIFVGKGYSDTKTTPKSKSK